MKRSAAQAAPPLALRALYVLVFVAITALGVGLTAPEWEQALSLVRPYHFGDPPSLVGLLASSVTLIAAVALLLGFARGARPSRGWSMTVLCGAVVCCLRAAVDESQGRSWAAADKQIIDAATALRERMVESLETDGSVPKGSQAWNAAMRELRRDSPALGRDLKPVPYEVVTLASQDAVPAALQPGTMLVWVSPEQDAFQLTPVGFDARGRVARLADASGHPLVLRNALSDFANDGNGNPPSER